MANHSLHQADVKFLTPIVSPQTPARYPPFSHILKLLLIEETGIGQRKEKIPLNCFLLQNPTKVLGGQPEPYVNIDIIDAQTASLPT